MKMLIVVRVELTTMEILNSVIAHKEITVTGQAVSLYPEDDYIKELEEKARKYDELMEEDERLREKNERIEKELEPLREKANEAKKKQKEFLEKLDEIIKNAKERR
jgi:predicted nuclease with TOPRIM domain